MSLKTRGVEWLVYAIFGGAGVCLGRGIVFNEWATILGSLIVMVAGTALLWEIYHDSRDNTNTKGK